MLNITKIRTSVPLTSILPETTAQGICPFCASARFRISAEQALYSCPDCGEKGDAITATMKINGLDFMGAVSQLTTTKPSNEGTKK